MKQDNNFLRGIKSLVLYNKSSHNGQTMEIRIDAVEKLIKEAERAERNKQEIEVMDRQLASEQKHVRELEEKLAYEKQRTIDLEYRLEREIHIGDILEEENQRYKQALEYIRELAEYDEYENTVEQVYNCTKKALEETE